MSGRSTFRNRLLLTLLGFVLLAELAVATAILHSTYNQTIAQAQHSLKVGKRVLDRLIAQRAHQLLSTVGIMTADFGFKSAVATHDGATLQTALENFGGRVHADVVMLADPSGKLTAAVPKKLGQTQSLPFQDLLAKARGSGSAVGLTMVDNHPYQFVLVPVYAPRVIAWVGMGFGIDPSLAQSLGSLTGLNVDFMVKENGKQVYRAHSGHALAGAPTPANAFMSTEQTLLDAGDAKLYVVLSLARGDVLSGYYALAHTLVLIFCVTLLINALVAVWLARKLSAPVRALSVFAKSVAAGEYARAPQSSAVGEFDILADALTDMQAAVKDREAAIRYRATHDALTDLPNRESIRQSLQHVIRSQRSFAAVRIAIHDFSRINGALGYKLGDEVLKTMAARLREALDSASTLGRVEGNDFLLLMETEAGEPGVHESIEAIRAAVQTPVHLRDTPVRLVLDIGIVMAPSLADNLDAVWRRSVIARDHSSRANGRTFFYQEGMDEKQRRELTIIRDLAPALKNNELTIAYQPLMTLASGLVGQVESLARWQHPALGFVPPDEFIGLAERSGQIDLITRWVVEQLTRQIDQWRSAGTPLGVSINLSADELANDSLNRLLGPLLEAAASPGNITLEVTESALLRDPTAAMVNLRQLQCRGARIAIDDFGTGYSSLTQLKQLSANELKIDKSLVLKLDTTAADQYIVRAVIDMGHRLGLQIVAEGIENAATLRYLTQHGADLMQGYYLARPMAADALTEWLRQHHSDRARWSADSVLGKASVSL